VLKTCPSSHPEPQPLRAVWIRGAPLLAAEAGRLINLLVPLINLLVPLSNDLGLDEDDILEPRICELQQCDTRVDVRMSLFIEAPTPCPGDRRFAPASKMRP
jgi:hypothetical protein